MVLRGDAIELALARLRDLALEHPEVAAEARASEREYFGGAVPADYGPGEPARLAARRHLEWFLLERPSEALGGVPAEALLERWVASAGEAIAEHPETLLASLAGVFEVTGVEPGRGLWLRDVLGLGEYPIDEPEAASAMERGDVAAGRIFPVGESLFRLSPAAVVVRSEGLAHALRRDMERARGGRRGTLRIAQTEIERMFHAPDAAPAARPDPARVEDEARARLREAGIPEPLARELLAALAAAAGRAGTHEAAAGGAVVVSEALDLVAFDTDADLELARRALTDLWAVLSATGPPPRRTPERGGGAPARDRGASRAEVREALARFDRARAEGRDLESSFAALEEDLGLEGTGGAEEGGAAPDFPGAVAAMVEEFLWETGREEGADEARRREVLRSLGRYGQRVGVFENVGRRELLDFSGRWLLDEDELESAADAERLLDALAAFCRWSEAHQEVALWTSFGETLERLARSLPRLAEARRHCAGPGAESGRVLRFDRGAGEAPLLVDADGHEQSIALDPALDARLRPGDLVRARLLPGGRADVLACYPSEVEELVPLDA